MRKVFHAAVANGVSITVPAVVITEWWRSGVREKERASLLRSICVESLEKHLAMAAGVALGLVHGATAVDAIVMASAATRGDTLYTSDVADLEALRAALPRFAGVQIVQV